MWRLLFIFSMIALALAACTKRPESSQQVNGSFEVDTLFTKDGCTVYRFFDTGYWRYFTNCKGATAWIEHEGKRTSPTGIEGGAN